MCIVLILNIETTKEILEETAKYANFNVILWKKTQIFNL